MSSIGLEDPYEEDEDVDAIGPLLVEYLKQRRGDGFGCIAE
jgi:hypothetical protein